MKKREKYTILEKYTKNQEKRSKKRACDGLRRRKKRKNILTNCTRHDIMYRRWGLFYKQSLFLSLYDKGKIGVWKFGKFYY